MGEANRKLDVAVREILGKKPDSKLEDIRRALRLPPRVRLSDHQLSNSVGRVNSVITITRTVPWVGPYDVQR